MDGVVLLRDFDITKVTFHEVTKSKKNGGKLMGVSYNGRRLRLQTEELAIPFGVESFKDEAAGTESTSVVCSLNGVDVNPRLQKFAEALRSFDEKVLTAVQAQSADIMGKEMSLEVLREFYRPLLKAPRDPKYSPLLKVKVAPLSAATGAMPRVFHRDRSAGSVDELGRGALVKLIVDVPYVYFVNKNFGATVKLFQACITQPSRGAVDPDAYIFCDDEDAPMGEGGAPSATAVAGGAGACGYDDDDF